MASLQGHGWMGVETGVTKYYYSLVKHQQLLPDIKFQVRQLIQTDLFFHNYSLLNTKFMSGPNLLGESFTNISAVHQIILFLDTSPMISSHISYGPLWGSVQLAKISCFQLLICEELVSYMLKKWLSLGFILLADKNLFLASNFISNHVSFIIVTHSTVLLWWHIVHSYIDILFQVH